jgi:fatty-acyl-CoA synthase
MNQQFPQQRQEGNAMNQPSYTQGRQDKPLLAMTIGEAFNLTVARYAERDALIVRHQNIRLTWQALADEVERCAKALIALGVEQGDRLGLWAPNCMEWCIAQFASAKVGAILVNINPAYRASELDYVLKQSGCRWLVCAHTFKTCDYHAMLNELLPDLPMQVPGRLSCTNLPGLHGIITLGEEAPAGFLRWKELSEFAEQTSTSDLNERSAQLQFDDPINIQYTSGTTGFPKGATLSHYNILNNGYMVGESLGLTEQDRLVIPVPLYHCFGMVMGNLGCLTHGSTMIYPAPSFEPLATLSAVSEEKATVLYGVPTMFIAELDHPEREHFDLSSLRSGIMAGSTCPIEVMRRVITEMHMSEVQIAYGMTETSPVSLQTGPDDELERRVTTVGRTQPHLENKIIDEQGRIVPRGQIGELCTRGYSVMLGYWENSKATSDVLDGARWMHTGDLACMDEQGYVQIVGRSKDMIIRGGENIYPREIEEFLFRHPSVADVQVIGIPDDKYGEEIVAWVKLHDGHSPQEEILRDFCKAHIAHFKVPRHFRFVDEFPMTVTGKIQKFRMREIMIEEMTRRKAS